MAHFLSMAAFPFQISFTFFSKANEVKIDPNANE
jgi:hypothetical protein